MKTGRKMRHDMRPLGKDILVNGKKNAGYTLLEMIVVVAILAVGLTIVGMSINTIFSLEMRQCTKDICAALGKNKIEQMTKTGNSYLHLYKESDGIYLDIYESGVKLENEYEHGNKIGNGKITITYTLSDNAVGTLDANGIVIAFNRSNGSFKTVGEAWALKFSTPPSHPAAYYKELVISSGGSNRTIVLWPNTGKFSVFG
jgi:prepilin-type N-terminal cleavage/methylation domain-containing protein